ncbi:Protein-S-isoprenylcysteine O-methyltransferase Ste14 [Alteromonadaceae bacterium Bs31]|nr:Protein-S-isoprenylcysteine O-methyltransferase Ste14 [Alteromonadaceae bacterium Bs31]
MAFLEHKVPPVLVLLVCALLMWLMPQSELAGSTARLFRWSLAVGFIVLAGVLGVVALAQFHRAKTSENPLRPQRATTLVKSGIYKISRNPMYTGLVCMLFAWAAYLWSFMSLLGVPLFIVYMTQFQIKPEERILEALFGEDYIAYKAKVRRWI